MGELSPFHWLLVAVIALLLFGPAKFISVGKGLGKGLGEGFRNFKSAMSEGEGKKEDSKKEKDVKPTEEKKS
jgi:sec-independent protein translocase protein TatA